MVNNYTDGKRNGVRYFNPQPGRGKFMPVAELLPDQRFVDESASDTPEASNSSCIANANTSAAIDIKPIPENNKSTTDNSKYFGMEVCINLASVCVCVV